MNEVIILLNRLSDNPTDDEKDVLDQAEQVEDALKNLGYSARKMFMGLNLEEISDELLRIKPDLVFNLVEGLNGKANLIHLAPALLESIRMPYTGCGHESMFLTSNKILAKKILRYNSVRTAAYFFSPGKYELDPQKTYIAKPLWEDASVGITDKNVFKGNSILVIDELRERFGNHFFIEEFIEGREFNVSILGGPEGPQVMPLAEIVFRNYPDDKPRIVNYAAKWEQETFEYTNTPRSFEFAESDIPFREIIRKTALNCWNIFGLKGYARVDFRVDNNNEPYVLEINANPCIEKDSGFASACKQAGLTFEKVIERIVYDAYR